MAAPAVAARISVDVLKGTWVRPDGGYTIEIKSIDPNGRIDATYFNPKLLPFAKARPCRKVRRCAYSSNSRRAATRVRRMKLSYDPASDRLKGIYYQAVVKQKFDVVFVRK